MRTVYKTSTLPQMLIDWPEILTPADEHKNSAWLAMSCAFTIRLNDIFLIYSNSILSYDNPTFCALSEITFLMRGPSTIPGRRALTRIPLGPNSMAKLFANPIMAHLVAA